MQKAIHTLIFAAVIVALLLWAQNQKAELRNEIVERDKMHKAIIDSLRQELNGKKVEELKLLTRLNVLQEELARKGERLKVAERRYAALKNTPVKKYTDTQVDSLLALWYGFRRK